MEGTKNPKSKILGATRLHVSDDDAGLLVGGIVEKGFSENQQTRPMRPPSAPRPSVLSFPVARHRSHGPVCLPIYVPNSFTATMAFPGFQIFSMCHWSRVITEQVIFELWMLEYALSTYNGRESVFVFSLLTQFFFQRFTS